MLAMKAYQGASKDGSNGCNEIGVDPESQHYVLIAFKNISNCHGTGIKIDIMTHFIIFIAIFE